jgi:hypothetical protein
MDPDRLLVWLDAVPDGSPPLRMGVVCRRHADAMVVPRGWTLDDRREARPRLFRVADRDATSELRRIKRPARKPHEAAHDEPQFAFDDIDADPSTDAADTDPAMFAVPVVVGDFVPSATADSDETRALPWRPVFDDADDLGGLLKADSPLLSRAFRGLTRDPKAKS